MKTTNISILLFIALSAIITGCKKRNGGIQTATVQFTIKYPDNYSQQFVPNTEVKLTSKGSGTTLTGFTNATGVATFTDVIPGNYDVAVSKTLTAAEGLALTGISQALTLNAIKNDVAVTAPQSATNMLQLAGSAAGSLVIKEVYYTGSKTTAGGNYFSDQFVEIYNNSTDVIFLDGLCIGDVFGNAGLINTTSIPSPFNTDINNVFVSNVWRIPGTGKQYPLNPGASIVIAQDGLNHKEATLNPNSPVDLSKADWETFNERPDGRDADAPGVPNLERVYFTGGFDWLITVFGPSLVIFRTDDFSKLTKVTVPGSVSLVEHVRLPNNLVIDTFESLKDGISGNFKRIPVALDAGFTFASNTYVAESLRRKVAITINGRRVLQDTNNSTNDFERLTTPTPKGF